MTRLAAFLSLVVAFAPACSKSTTPAEVEAEMAVNAELGSEALVEEHDEGNVAWSIDSDGQVRAAVNASSGDRIKEDIGGTLVWKTPEGEPKTVPLTVDAKTGFLVAAGPKLEADLTEVDYTLTVSGKPWSGVLHVPVGGTAALVASANASAEVELPDTGPHGGTIQVVGEDRLEMVSDSSGEVRVYVFDADLKPRVRTSGSIRLGFVAGHAETLVLAPVMAGAYFVGKLANPFDPFKVTVSASFGGTTHVALWGYRPGVHIIASPLRAPRVAIHVNTFVETDYDVEYKVKYKAHSDNGLHLGQYKDHDDHGHSAKAKVQIGDKGHGGSEKVNVHVKTGSSGGGSKVHVQTKTGSSGGGSKVHVQTKAGGGAKVSSGGSGSKGRKK